MQARPGQRLHRKNMFLAAVPLGSLPAKVLVETANSQAITEAPIHPENLGSHKDDAQGDHGLDWCLP